MKLANLKGRAVLILNEAIADVHDVSGGHFGPDPMGVYEEWAAFVQFAKGVTTGRAPLKAVDLRSRAGVVVKGPSLDPATREKLRSLGYRF